jgi:hypothetical protein
MQRLIHNIRNKPEKVRRHILHVATIVCGIILCLLWVYSLGATLTNPNIQAKISNDLKPLSAMKDNILGGYNSLTNQNSATVEQSQ